MFDSTYRFDCSKGGPNLIPQRAEQACRLLVKGKVFRRLASRISAGAFVKSLSRTAEHAA